MNTPVESNEPPFKLKFVPLAVTVGLTILVVIGGGGLAVLTARLFHAALPKQSIVNWLFVQHTFMLILALIAIAVLKFRFVPADYGLHWPRGKTYIGPAILINIGIGIVMTLVDYAPQVLAHSFAHAGWPPGFAFKKHDIWRWIGFQVYVGPTEEIPFRALLVTYLAATMPGKLHVGRFSMNWAGVIVGIIFALAHASNFFVIAWPLALGQQVYAFVAAVLYAYWLEKSRSVVAPMIGHSVGDLVEMLIVFTCMGVF